MHSTAKSRESEDYAGDEEGVVIVNGKAIFDIETLSDGRRLLVVGQQRGVEVTYISQYELSHVPPSLIGEFGCLRKGDNTVLVKCLGVPVSVFFFYACSGQRQFSSGQRPLSTNYFDGL